MITYRELQPTDVPAIFAVRLKTWPNPHGAEELLRLGNTPETVIGRLLTSHRGWVAVDEGEVIGFVMGNQHTGELWVIAVLPSHENRGVGRRLLSLVEEWLWSAGWSELWLTTDLDENFRAVGFYRRLGWVDWKLENGDRFMRKPAACP